MFHKSWFRAVLVLAVLASLVVAPLFVSAQTENGITAPADGATVSGTVTITGYADDPNFKRWDLFVFPGGDDSGKLWVASGDTAGEFSVDLDTTKYPDGEHALGLRVVTNPRQNYTEYTTSFTIANAEAPAAVAVEEEAAVEEAAPVVEEVAAPAEETAAPVNGFDAEDGIEVSDTVTVTGYADTTGFVKWQLDVIPFGEADDAIFLATGKTAGEFSYALDTTAFPDGDHQLRLRIVDNTGNYDEYFVDVTVANGEAEPVAAVAATEAVTETEEAEAPAAIEAPAAVETPANGLDLEDGATVSGTVDVTGYADDANFKRWDLFIFPGGDENAKIWVASGSTAGEFTVTLDTTQFPDGEHVFGLRVVTNPRQNYTEYTTAFVVANAE
jgi:hypothetical protein